MLTCQLTIVKLLLALNAILILNELDWYKKRRYLEI